MVKEHQNPKAEKRRDVKRRVPVRREPTHEEARKSKRDEALRAALASAFAAPPAPETAVDAYGSGNPTDRLQFGYSPSITAEAVAFHSTISAKAWVEERRRLGRIAIVKHQRLTRPNCEPMVSLLKLKNHWRTTAQFFAEVRRGGGVREDRAEDILEMLAAKQRVA